MYSSQAINRLSVCLWPFVLNPPVLSSSRMKILNRGRCRLRPKKWVVRNGTTWNSAVYLSMGNNGLRETWRFYKGIRHQDRFANSEISMGTLNLP